MTKNNYVSWKVFVWAFGVMLLVLSFALTAVAQVRGEVNGIQSQYTEIQIQLTKIQTDIEWLKLNI